ncbi:P-loop containing nucleoside triphosphate hydrolase protein [Limtongia smithiae]|uniref:P-loop containing nucleoside triphosphate hydrolase protein n=1 Tax=Limtongia smithiae TaxID=1125753 RepID=UPI0034CE25AA
MTASARLKTSPLRCCSCTVASLRLWRLYSESSVRAFTSSAALCREKPKKHRVSKNSDYQQNGGRPFYGKIEESRLAPDMSYARFMRLVYSRVSLLKLSPAKSAILRFTKVPADLYNKHIGDYIQAVCALPENQFTMETAPKYEDFMEDNPTLPHLAILKILQNSARRGTTEGLQYIDAMLTTCFGNYLKHKEKDSKFTSQSRATQQSKKEDTQALANIANPAEQFPMARAMRRKWILHVGPTNSGKTHNALKRLGEASSGLYAGPLRLLAREIYDRFKARGRSCNLVTGEEVIWDKDSNGLCAKITSCTVEMANVSTEYEVAVIDEIQMITDPFRGWAWSAAVLGIQAKEIHLCGEERTVNLLCTLASMVGDIVEVNRYQRLSPLEIESNSLQSSLAGIRPGDAVVTFSRTNIFAIKRKIENETAHKCAVIYGGLPPETRAKQAQLFNDPSSGYNVMVASDAIGMGLNLSVKRIIFETSVKYDGVAFRRIDPNQIKQIAGRAGRYRSAVEVSNPNAPDERLGFVTTLDKSDHKYLVRCMTDKARQIQHAGTLPNNQMLHRFSQEFSPTTAYDVVLTKFYNFATASNYFSMCSFLQQIGVAKMFGDVEGLRMNEKTQLIKAPASLRLDVIASVMQHLATAISLGNPISIVDIPQFDLQSVEFANVAKSSTLKNLEQLHSVVALYLWLSYRFPVVLFDREGALELNHHIQMLIDRCLNTIQFRRQVSRVIDDDLDQGLEGLQTAVSADVQAAQTSSTTAAAS